MSDTRGGEEATRRARRAASQRTRRANTRAIQTEAERAASLRDDATRRRELRGGESFAVRCVRLAADAGATRARRVRLSPSVKATVRETDRIGHAVARGAAKQARCDTALPCNQLLLSQAISPREVCFPFLFARVRACVCCALVFVAWLTVLCARCARCAHARMPIPAPQVNTSTYASVVEFATCRDGAEIESLMTDINTLATSNAVFRTSKRRLLPQPPCEFVHGASDDVPSVAVWIPPATVAAIAAEGQVNAGHSKWVVAMCVKLTRLGKVLPEWTTSSSTPVVLFYPSREQLNRVSAGGVTIASGGREQAMHLDQPPGCPKAMNFCVPSAGRGFTTVMKICDRHFPAFLAKHLDSHTELQGALQQLGQFHTAIKPDGKTAIAFSSGTPHYGTGGDTSSTTSVIFFAGDGAAAHLVQEGGLTYSYQTGRKADGTPRAACGFDAVWPLNRTAVEYGRAEQSLLRASGASLSAHAAARVHAMDAMCNLK